MPRSRFDKIHNLADMLGIPVSKLKKPEDFLLDPNEPRLAASNGVKFCHSFNLFGCNSPLKSPVTRSKI